MLDIMSAEFTANSRFYASKAVLVSTDIIKFAAIGHKISIAVRAAANFVTEFGS